MKIGNKRASFINYKKPGIFMISMNKAQEASSFCEIIEVPKEIEIYKRYRPDYSELGFIIFYAFKDWVDLTSKIKIFQYVIMPDHIHFLLEITENLDKHLGIYLQDFKKRIYARALTHGLIKETECHSIFEPGYNDQFLRSGRSLDDIYRYIRTNPYWWWMRRKNPENFRREDNLLIAGEECSLYGNLRLLDNPFKYPVIVHRTDLANPEILRKKKEAWEYAIYNGGVIVGGFINEEEKRIRDLAYEEGGKVIYLKDEGFEKREKPSRNQLEQCMKGNLLLMTPHRLMHEKNWGVRQKSLYKNSLAERICFGSFAAGPG